MPSTIIDLDAVLGEPKRVKLGGKVYNLPPDIPVELYLRIQQAAVDGADDEQMIQTLHDGVLDLFRYGDPKLTQLPAGMTLGQLMVAIGEIYGAREETNGQRPTRTRGGAANSRSKTRSRS